MSNCILILKFEIEKNHNLFALIIFFDMIKYNCVPTPLTFKQMHKNGANSIVVSLNIRERMALIFLVDLYF